MRFFIINTMPLSNREYCLLETPPEGTEAIRYKLTIGAPLGSEYPGNAPMKMSYTYPGIQVPSIVANTMSMLIVSGNIKDAIGNRVKEQIEYLPVSILDHKMRVVSSNHYLINPIGGFDCLDLENSSIQYLDGDPDKVITVDSFVFDLGKMERAPHLFRVKQDLCKFVLSEELVSDFQEMRCTNVFLEEVEFGPAQVGI